ncbi:FAD:protein FMN transferase [Luteococcus sanguinis]|uniref:FAD:protein FMN transferase n=1 Tax=Luteococcus sanguinis TaxID=174038 RepID=UPI00337B4E07
MFVHDLPTDPSQTITPTDGMAVATSSTQKRRWTASGRAAHHMLDPRTLTPAPVGWHSVTVAAPSAALANTLSCSLSTGGRSDAPVAPHQ